VIFATVGTHHQQFDRLVGALADRDDVIVQYGHSAPPRGRAQAVAFMSFAEMEAHMRDADAVVTHAGVGSILLARRCGKMPVVVPRRQRFGEHVDDHQVELAAALGPRGEVVVVDDVAGLEAVLSEPPARRPPADAITGTLHTAVRAALWAGSVNSGGAAKSVRS
jgi:UDP-N-acetylglucosamine transferase subunit ALG13